MKLVSRSPVNFVPDAVVCAIATASIYYTIHILFRSPFEIIYHDFYKAVILFLVVTLLLFVAGPEEKSSHLINKYSESDPPLFLLERKASIGILLCLIFLWHQGFMFPIYYLLLALIAVIYVFRGSINSPNIFGLGQIAAILLPLMFFHAWYNYVWHFIIFTSIYFVICHKFLSADDHNAEFALIHYPSTRDIGFLLIIGACLALSVYVFKRPDADDEFYLGQIVQMIDLPSLDPVRHTRFEDIRFDSAPRDALLESYLISAAVMSRALRIDPHFIYYVFWPTFWAFFFPLVAYRYISNFASRFRIAGVIFTCLVLFLWGYGHHTYGNMSFLRLYQGKAVLVLVLIPLIACYAIELMQRSTFAGQIKLGMALLAGVSLNSTCIVVGPLAAVCAAFFFVQFTPKRLIHIASRFVFPLLILLLFTIPVVVGMDASESESTYRKMLGNAFSGPGDNKFNNHGSFGFGQGYWFFGWVAAMCLLMQLGDKSSNVIGFLRLILVYMIFSVLPWFSGWISEFTSPTIRWRFAWLAPWFLVAGGLLAKVSEGFFTKSARKYRAFPVVAAISLLTVMWLSGDSILASKNHVVISTNIHPYAPENYQLAETVVGLSERSDYVLAPYEVASVLAIFSDHPGLVVRRRSWVDKKTDSLVRSISFPKQLPDSRLEEVVMEIMLREIDTVLIPELYSDGRLENRLEYRGYRCRRDHGHLICSIS